METTFIAKLSKTSFLITIIFNVLLIVILFINVFQAKYHHPVSTVFILLLPVLIHLLHPVSYTIHPDTIRINRVFQPISILTTDILHMETIHASELAVNIRLLGSGGVWGYFGVYYSTTHGKLIMMASDMQNLILIVTSQKKYVISPEKPTVFLDTYNNRRITYS